MGLTFSRMVCFQPVFVLIRSPDLDAFQETRVSLGGGFLSYNKVAHVTKSDGQRHCPLSFFKYFCSFD